MASLNRQFPNLQKQEKNASIFEVLPGGALWYAEQKIPHCILK